MDKRQITSFFDPTRVLLVTVACFTIIGLVKFFWSRRKLYRLSFQLPGPPGYPIIGNLLDFIGFSTEVLFQTTSRYFASFPEMFKIWAGPLLVVGVSDPEHLEIILNSPHSIGKGAYYDFTKSYMGNGLLSAPVHIWRKNRKLINPSFNQKILDSYVEIFSEQTKILVEIMEKRAEDKDFDIFPLMSASLVDTICETAMGVKVNSQTTSNNFGELLDRAMEVSAMRVMKLWYQNEFLFGCSKTGKEFKKIVSTLNRFTDKVISEKRKHFEKQMEILESGENIEEGRVSKSFLDLLLRLSHEGTNLSDEELRDEVNTFMAAGSDTTATSMCFCLLALGMYPEIQRKVYEEVIDALGEDRDVTAEDLPRLQYMDRVLKETLRLFPPGPMLLRNVTSDIDLNGVVIPPNCNFVIGVIHTHRNSKYWKDPLQFNPDRFLPEEVAKRHPYSYIPFSGGPRGCIGSKFAQMNMKALLATVLRKLLIKTDYETIADVKLKINLLLKPTNGFKVSIKVRER